MAARAGSCILVVDDEKDIRETVKDLIECSLAGARVRTAPSGPEGLRVLQEEGGAIGLIITDLRMPGMDGVEFLREAGKVAPEVPKLMVTAHTGGTAPPGSQLLHKPFDADRFLGVVEQALRHHGPGAAGTAEASGSA